MNTLRPTACLLREREDPDVDQEAPCAWDDDAVHDASRHHVGPGRDDGQAATQPLRGAVARLDESELTGLVARIQRRDARALAALYEMAGARVYHFAHRFMRSHALTEEVVEDTFWQVWRQAPRFERKRGRVMVWLLAMARSRAIDALRRERRFLCEPMASPDEAPRADELAHDLLEAARGASRLHDALATLEPRGRQLLALAFFRGFTHEEIAAHARMPLGSVKSVIRRALLQLREQLLATPRSTPESENTP